MAKVISAKQYRDKVVIKASLNPGTPEFVHLAGSRSLRLNWLRMVPKSL